ncbi:MAG: hypothetical protein ACKVQK_16325 [Burkholderiales bacterium]
MNAPDTQRRLVTARKLPRTKKARKTRSFLAELSRQCQLANAADKRDSTWAQLVYLPE